MFCGDSKSDATYDVWRYEVECLLNESYKPETISHAIRRSLKGEASRVVMHLGPGASIISRPRSLAVVMESWQRERIYLLSFTVLDKEMSDVQDGVVD